ncbi:hypothetical protein HMPREF0208_01011 [Citrobacter koseri]|nr:hypothetical protein HMPREF0208_01011 [Citrobacter koseri]
MRGKNRFLHIIMRFSGHHTASPSQLVTNIIFFSLKMSRRP